MTDGADSPATRAASILARDGRRAGDLCRTGVQVRPRHLFNARLAQLWLAAGPKGFVARPLGRREQTAEMQEDRGPAPAAWLHLTLCRPMNPSAGRGTEAKVCAILQTGKETCHDKAM